MRTTWVREKSAHRHRGSWRQTSCGLGATVVGAASQRGRSRRAGQSPGRLSLRSQGRNFWHVPKDTCPSSLCPGEKALAPGGGHTFSCTGLAQYLLLDSQHSYQETRHLAGGTWALRRCPGSPKATERRSGQSSGLLSCLH